jgi:hypothetical protein
MGADSRVYVVIYKVLKINTYIYIYIYICVWSWACIVIYVHVDDGTEHMRYVTCITVYAYSWDNISKFQNVFAVQCLGIFPCYLLRGRYGSCPLTPSFS